MRSMRGEVGWGSSSASAPPRSRPFHHRRGRPTMADDDLLDELARIAREQRRPVDPRWEALARGELAPDEREKLLADEGDELLPLFEPLGDAFADEAAARILARAGADKPVAPPLRSAEV